MKGEELDKEAKEGNVRRTRGYLRTKQIENIRSRKKEKKEKLKREWKGNEVNEK